MACFSSYSLSMSLELYSFYLVEGLSSALFFCLFFLSCGFLSESFLLSLELDSSSLVEGLPSLLSFCLDVLACWISASKLWSFLKVLAKSYLLNEFVGSSALGYSVKELCHLVVKMVDSFCGLTIEIFRNPFLLLASVDLPCFLSGIMSIEVGGCSNMVRIQLMNNLEIKKKFKL